MSESLSIWPNIDEKISHEAESIKNKAFRGAFMKGVIACREKGIEAKNPYKSIYQPNGKGGTFAMAFRNYWNKGWNTWKKHTLNYCGIHENEVKNK